MQSLPIECQALILSLTNAKTLWQLHHTSRHFRALVCDPYVLLPHIAGQTSPLLGPNAGGWFDMSPAERHFLFKKEARYVKNPYAHFGSDTYFGGKKIEPNNHYAPCAGKAEEELSRRHGDSTYAESNDGRFVALVGLEEVQIWDLYTDKRLLRQEVQFYSQLQETHGEWEWPEAEFVDNRVAFMWSSCYDVNWPLYKDTDRRWAVVECWEFGHPASSSPAASSAAASSPAEPYPVVRKETKVFGARDDYAQYRCFFSEGPEIVVHRGPIYDNSHHRGPDPCRETWEHHWNFEEFMDPSAEPNCILEGPSSYPCIGRTPCYFYINNDSHQSGGYIDDDDDQVSIPGIRIDFGGCKQPRDDCMVRFDIVSDRSRVADPGWVQEDAEERVRRAAVLPLDRTWYLHVYDLEYDCGVAWPDPAQSFHIANADGDDDRHLIGIRYNYRDRSGQMVIEDHIGQRWKVAPGYDTLEALST